MPTTTMVEYPTDYIAEPEWITDDLGIGYPAFENEIHLIDGDGELLVSLEPENLSSLIVELTQALEGERDRLHDDLEIVQEREESLARLEEDN